MATSLPGLQLQEAGDRWTILGPGLRLTFSLVGERWVHDLALADDSGELFPALITTVEGDDGGGDPARVISPAYQEIHEHEAGEAIRLLLTGQATPHHFSAVFTARREGEAILLELDVADRTRRPVEALAATYLVQLGSGDLLDAGPGGIAWGGPALGQGRLEFVADAPGLTALAEAGRRGTRVQALARLATSAATHRLAYRWRWTPGPRARPG